MRNYANKSKARSLTPSPDSGAAKSV